MEEQINALTKLGYNLVKFINPISQSEEIYIWDTFAPVDSISSTSRTFKHKIRGRNVTEFIPQRMTSLHNNVSQLEENVIRSNINALPIINREFSSHFLWINYLAGNR